MGGAIVVFTLVLYPYVFLLARAALARPGRRRLRRRPQPRRRAARGRSPGHAAPAAPGDRRRCRRRHDGDAHRLRHGAVLRGRHGLGRVSSGSGGAPSTATPPASSPRSFWSFALMIIGLERVLRGRARFGQAAGEAAGLGPRRLTGVRAAAAPRGVCLAVLAAAFGAPTAQLVVWAVERGHRSAGNAARRPVLRVPLALACCWR